jgi:hypothetical protein
LKPYKSKLPYKTYVKHLVANLKSYLFLQDWQFTLEFPLENPVDKSDVIASIHSDSTYLNAIIEFFPNAYFAWRDDPIEDFVEYVLHELIHAQTDAVYQFAKIAASEATMPHLITTLEQQTQRLARIIFQSLPKSVYQL